MNIGLLNTPDGVMPQLKYRVGQKPGLFLRLHSFAMVEMRVKILQILQIHCPWNYAEFDNNAWFLLNFHAEYSETTILILQIRLVYTKFNVCTLDLDNRHQCFDS